MNKKEIDALIHRYFEAETTLEEEELLHAYFQKENLDDDLKMYQGYFGYFQSKKNVVAPQHLEERILKNIREESKTAKGIRMLRVLARVAAIFILGFGLWFLYQYNAEKQTQPTASAVDWSKYEVKSEEEAVKVMQMALRRTSTELKKGAGIARKEIHTTKERWSFLK